MFKREDKLTKFIFIITLIFVILDLITTIIVFKFSPTWYDDETNKTLKEEYLKMGDLAFFKQFFRAYVYLIGVYSISLFILNQIKIRTLKRNFIYGINLLYIAILSGIYGEVLTGNIAYIFGMIR